MIEEKGEIVGLITLETIVHIGPIWASPSASKPGIFTRLIEGAYKLCPPVRGGVLIADNPKIARLSRRMRLREILQPVFIWEK